MPVPEPDATKADPQIERGSVPVIEAFYGESLSPGLLRSASVTPFDQLLVLAERIRDRQDQITGQLRRHRIALTHDDHTVRDLLMAGGRTHYKHEQMIVSENLYFDGMKAFSIVDQPGFKHWFLYAESLVLPDPAFWWADDLRFGADDSDEEFYQRSIRSAVAYLLVLKPMLECDSLVLIPDKDTLIPDDFLILPLSRLTELGSDDPDLLWYDPYLASVIADMDFIPPWERTVLGLDDPRDAQELVSRLVCDIDLMSHFPEIWQQAHPEASLDISGYKTTLGLAALHRATGLTPAPNQDISRRHLLRTTGTSLEGTERPSLLPHELEAATTLRLPDLSSVSIEELVKLRRDEETLERLRCALLELAKVVEQDDAPSYGTLQEKVASAADDILGPVYDHLTQEVRRRSVLAKVLGWGTSGLVHLGISGGAALTTGPAAGLAPRGAGPVSVATGKFVRRKVAARNESKEIARSLIMSTLPPDRDVP